MGRAAYIRRRLILMAFVLFGVTVVIFGMVRVLPGDPAFLILGDRATDQKAAELREQLGLNRPVLEQYWMFVWGFAPVNKGQWPDQLIRIGFLFALTTPNFWFGILLILLFGLTLHWFPLAGFGETP